MVVLRLISRFAEHAYSDLDEGTTGLSLVVPKRFPVGLVFFARSDHGGERSRNDTRIVITKVVHLVVDSGKPRAIVVMTLVLEAGDYTRPIESRRTIEPILGVGQINRGPDLIRPDLRFRVIRAICNVSTKRAKRQEYSCFHSLPRTGTEREADPVVGYRLNRYCCSALSHCRVRASLYIQNQ